MDNLCTTDGSLAPDWFYHRTNTFRTSEKQTPLNSEQQTLISPQRTLANITSENGQWSYTHIMRTLVNHFRNATTTGFKEWALLLIVWAFLVSIKQRRGPKLQPFRAFNSPADHRLPRLQEVYWIPITEWYLRIPDTQWRSALYKYHSCYWKKHRNEAEYTH